MLLSIAWRNIWRSKVRSLIIIAAITIGIFSGSFMWAFYEGMVEQRIRNAIKTEASHIQIHHKNYLTNPDQNLFLDSCSVIEKKLLNEKGVLATTSRILVNSMITSAHTGTGVKITGIDPENEKKVTDISNKITDGAYFDNSVKRNPVVIGAKLANKLGVKLRSKVFLTLQQRDGTLIRTSFKVAGIYSSGNTGFDELNVFVRKSDLLDLLNFSQEQAHEIAVLLIANPEVDEYKILFQKLFPECDVKTWRELMPEVSLVEETMDVSMIFFLSIILLGLLFGIINTMLMSVLERTKELGMLMAVGMTPVRIFFMIMYETIMLALTGGFFGVIIAVLFCIITNYTGIDLSKWSEAYQKMGYDSIVYPVISIKIIVDVTIMVIITGILGAILPAIKALKLRPVEAIRNDN